VTPSITRSGAIIFLRAFPQGFLKCCMRILDVDVGDASRQLRRVVQTDGAPLSE
jgi:hypothetical protein